MPFSIFGYFVFGHDAPPSGALWQVARASESWPGLRTLDSCSQKKSISPQPHKAAVPVVGGRLLFVGTGGTSLPLGCVEGAQRWHRLLLVLVDSPGRRPSLMTAAGFGFPPIPRSWRRLLGRIQDCQKQPEL